MPDTNAAPLQAATMKGLGFSSQTSVSTPRPPKKSRTRTPASEKLTEHPRSSRPRDRFSTTHTPRRHEPYTTSRAHQTETPEPLPRPHKKKARRRLEQQMREMEAYRETPDAESSETRRTTTADASPAWYGHSALPPYVDPSSATKPYTPSTPSWRNNTLGAQTTPLGRCDTFLDFSGRRDFHTGPTTRAFRVSNTRSTPRSETRDRSPRIPVRNAPQPTQEYLDLASQPPVDLPSPQKLLIVLDLNGTLMFRMKAKARMNSAKPLLRPGIHKFMDYIFENFAVMVWTSARPENAEQMVAATFTKTQRAKLLGIWARALTHPSSLRMVMTHTRQ